MMALRLAGLSLLAVVAQATEDCIAGPASAALPAAVPQDKYGPHINAWLGVQDIIKPELSRLEGPIAIRAASMIDLFTWSCIATYHPTWTDTIMIDEAPVAGRAPEALHTSDARVLCTLHGYATLFPTLLVTSLPAYVEYARDLGVVVELGAGFPHDMGSKLSMCYATWAQDNNIEVDAPEDLWERMWETERLRRRVKKHNSASIRRPDKSLDKLRTCLAEASTCHGYDPAYVGAALARFVHEYFYFDGFNAAGAIGKNGEPCTANCRPFSDYSGYFPVNHPGNNKERHHWEPLQEDTGRGFFYRQEHVTPFIGKGALGRVLSRKEIDCRGTPPPKYDYDQEVKKVVKRMRKLTDEQKMLVELFDNKINVGAQTLKALLLKYPDEQSFEALALYLVAFTTAEHDATVVAWKEKKRWDAVRTTTLVQALEKDLRTYAGPGQGVQKIKAQDFQPYIRVMPHAEYPSGSACQCQSFMEITDGFTQFTYGDEESVSFSLTFPAKSSVIEPGLTPAEDVHVYLANYKEIRDTCGQSRLDGGQHFTKSVPASYKLCEGLGDQVLGYIKGLTNGQSVLEGL